MLNGKFKCIWADGVDHTNEVMTENKVYEFKDGVFIREDGHKSNLAYTSIEDFERTNKEHISIIPYTEKLPQPHKSLLKSGMKVVYRDGQERYVLIETGGLYDVDKGEHQNWFMAYEDTLISKLSTVIDIMEIYDGEMLIAKRVEKTPEQIEIEKIESELRELSTKQSELADRLNKLKK